MTLEKPLTDPSDHTSTTSELRIAIVDNRTASVARSDLLNWDDLCEVLSWHAEQESKHGPAAIFGDLHGGRCDENVESVSCLVYDIDGKLTEPEIADVVAGTGFEAVHYTTYNHCKTVSMVGLKTYQKWARKNGCGETPTDVTIAAFCAANPKYDHLESVQLLDGGGTVRVRLFDSQFDAYRIGHDPEHKTRVIFLLSSPIPVKEIGIDAYKATYHAVGQRVFGDRYDRTCANPARLQYFPSHPPGAIGFVTKHHRGDPLEWEDIYDSLKSEIQIDREERVTRRKAWDNSAPRNLTELHHVLKSIPSDIPRDEWFKALAALFHETRGSDEGNQLAHSWSARDYDAYDFDEVESIWDSFDPDHPRPATMGTLVKLARQYDETFGSQSKRPKIDWNYD